MSSFGENIKVSIFGQSHGGAIGVVVEGLPWGFTPDLEKLSAFCARRAPGGKLSTARKEADAFEVLSGLADGHTCGAPLAMIIRNTDTKSRDYSELFDKPRPGHADFAAQAKFWGYQDVAGGGHFSGRLTAPLCMAGGLAMQILESRGVYVGAHALSIGSVHDAPFDPVRVDKQALDARTFAPITVNDLAVLPAMEREILSAKENLDSVGGCIECAVVGAPAGWGDPMFLGMENRIAQIVFGIPAVKGIEFGAGFGVCAMHGSENNDPYAMENGKAVPVTNNAGGILGGITTGAPIIFRAAIKPTPSIAQQQQSVSLSAGENTPLSIHGRHDPCIVHRAIPCVEAAAALAVLDAALSQDKYQGRK